MPPHNKPKVKPKIDKPTATQSQTREKTEEYLPSAISKKSVIDHPVAEIKHMEVHHHPEIDKKGFKEYILEGLMIFIAVMMGFFAESLREHITERNRAKEYALTMYSDLKDDTTELKSFISYTDYAANNVDTLMQLLSKKNDPKLVPSGKLYWFGLWGGASRTFIPHDATLMEMKSSGSLRYFISSSLNRKVAQYDQLCQSIKTMQDAEQGIYIDVRKIRAQLFDFKYNDAANNVAFSRGKPFFKARVDSFIKTNPPILSYDKIIFNQYVEMVRSRYLKRKAVAADTLLKHAGELIGALKKEYDLENE